MALAATDPRAPESGAGAGRRPVRALAILLLVPGAAALLAGMAGGLLRAGVLADPGAAALVAARAAAGHAALMICGFLGTVIGIERAVALQRRYALVVPLLSGAAGGLIVVGAPGPAAWAAVGASAAFLFVNAALLRRQRAAHTVMLGIAALAWFAGCIDFAVGGPSSATLSWWFGFLVLTIAAERLEMTRLMRARALARVALFALAGALTGGAALTDLDPAAGGLVYGAALVLIALWLGSFDIARRTVRVAGLSRYMALCLLAGYAWLAAGGLAWAAAAVGAPSRDAGLHAIGLGFVLSMVMAHAPVILPAVAGIRLRFGWMFYLPAVLLHLSLIVRLGPGLNQPAWKSAGAALNALAIVLFLLTVAVTAFRGRTPADRARP